jgi:hypothetical protein
MRLSKALLGEAEQLGWVTAGQHEFIQTWLLVCNTSGEKIGASQRVAARQRTPTVTIAMVATVFHIVCLLRDPSTNFTLSLGQAIALVQFA